MCRYNLPLANKAISTELGFSKADMGAIITTALLAYACGQIINGLIADRIGGKRAMLIGAAGTIVMNLLFGAASFVGLLALFVAIRGVDGYMQAFGAPGMVKINAAWFQREERGRFAGVFGFMINLGRLGIFTIGPLLLLHLHWRWLFWIPALVCAGFALLVLVFAKDTPEEESEVPPEKAAEVEVRASVKDTFLTIARQPVVWFIACANACTGAVRQGIDQWFPRFLEEVHHVQLDSARFRFLAILIPIVAAAGSLVSGYISDHVFKGRRAPVAAGLYFVESAIILAASQVRSVDVTILFLVLIAFTANSTHSLLGTAAPMDIGGRKMAGFAAGLIDSFQYFGGSLAGYALGKLLDVSWGYYFYFMVPFGLTGGILMLVATKRMDAQQRESHA
jgi:OPA family glycerol-3-phosphate transporter-like MFS transporter